MTAAPGTPSAGPGTGSGPFNLTLFHTNDSHSYIFPRPAAWRDDGRLVGGVVALSSALARERLTAPNSILLDAGDFMTGNPVCQFAPDGVPGAAIARLMNRLGYDAGTIGNHEFDIGLENLKKLVRLFDYPLIAADILDTAGRPVFRAEPLILERGGLRIGIMGVSCAGMAEVVAPSRFAGLAMGSQVNIVRAQAAALDPETDLLILLTHDGVGEDRELAKLLEGSGVDIIVGGHSHSRLKQPLVDGGILIVQAGSKFTNLGRLDLQVADDRVVRYEGKLIDLWADAPDSDEPAADPELVAMVDGYRQKVDEVYGRVIGTLVTDWTKGRGEYNLGDFLADGIRNTASADVAFINSGGVRKTLEAGPITALDIHEILPFSNTIVTVELTGKQLADIVQQNADAAISGKHGILQVSGLSYGYRANADTTGALVENLRVQGQLLDEERLYLAALPDFVAMMKDVYLGIDLPPVHDLGETLTEAIIRQVEAQGTIDSRIEGRIRRLD